MGDCKGLTGWLFGHDYRARYSYGPPQSMKTQTWGLNWAEDMTKVMQASKSKTYHSDVCRRCGHQVLPGTKQ